jgi:hypothetical protein
MIYKTFIHIGIFIFTYWIWKYYDIKLIPFIHFFLHHCIPEPIFWFSLFAKIYHQYSNLKKKYQKNLGKKYDLNIVQMEQYDEKNNEWVLIQNEKHFISNKLTSIIYQTPEQINCLIIQQVSNLDEFFIQIKEKENDIIVPFSALGKVLFNGKDITNEIRSIFSSGFDTTFSNFLIYMMNKDTFILEYQDPYRNRMYTKDHNILNNTIQELFTFNE